MRSPPSDQGRFAERKALAAPGYRAIKPPSSGHPSASPSVQAEANDDASIQRFLVSIHERFFEGMREPITVHVLYGQLNLDEEL